MIQAVLHSFRRLAHIRAQSTIVQELCGKDDKYSGSDSCTVQG